MSSTALVAPSIDRSAVDELAGRSLGATFDRYPRWRCSDDDCPGRPDWDRALDARYTDERERLADLVERLLRDELAATVARFEADHPEVARA